MVRCVKVKLEHLRTKEPRQMKGVKHYKKDGSEHKGSSHKMANGTLHTNKAHTKTSVRLFHYGDLSKSAKKKAMS